MVYVDDPLRNPHYYLTNSYWSTTNLPWLINHVADCGRDHWGCGARLTMEGSVWLHSILFVAGALMIAWRLSEKDMRDAFGSLSMRFDDEQGRLVMMLALLVATVVINAFVCGALSGPFARYQARIAWLADLGGALGLVSLVPAEATAPAIASRLRTHPLAVAFEKRFDPAFIRFGLVGTAGFLVHATVLHAMVNLVGLNVYLGLALRLRGRRHHHALAQSRVHLPPTQPPWTMATGGDLSDGAGRRGGGQLRRLCRQRWRSCRRCARR